MQPSSKMLSNSSPEGAMLCLSSPHKKCQCSPPLDKCCKAAPLKKYHKAATTKCFTATPLELSLQAPLTLKPSLRTSMSFSKSTQQKAKPLYSQMNTQLKGINNESPKAI